MTFVQGAFLPWLPGHFSKRNTPNDTRRARVSAGPGSPPGPGPRQPAPGPGPRSAWVPARPGSTTGPGSHICLVYLMESVLYAFNIPVVFKTYLHFSYTYLFTHMHFPFTQSRAGWIGVWHQTWYWVLGTKCLVPGNWHQLPGALYTWCLVPGTSIRPGTPVPGARCLAPGNWHQVPGA